MSTLIAVVASLAALSLALWLWRERREHAREIAYLTRRSEAAPAVDPFSPLFCTLAEALDAGVIVVGPTRTVRYCNRTASAMFGVPRADALNHGVITLLRDYQADTLINQSIIHRDPQQLSIQPVLSNRTIRIWCEPIAEGALLITRDLTQLNQLERARRDLVANVSHELRTPLASIKLLVETLETNPPPDLAQRMLGQMGGELAAVMQLVDELHELSQLESGRMVLQLQPTPVAELVDQAVERIEAQVRHRALSLSARVNDDLPLVYVDRSRMSQVLLNLLHNAVKWTEDGGSIALEAKLRSREELEPHLTLRTDPPPQWVTIAVRDTGAGIPAEALGRIFERFYKVDRARTRGKGGTGLGLAIVKHLVEGHGGSVWASSIEGQGSTFTIALPVVD